MPCRSFLKRRLSCGFRKFPCYSPELFIQRTQSWHEAPKGETMWADAETEVDFLNYSEVAELVAELIGTPDLMPLSLGVFGTWGTGKSSTLKFVKTELLRTPDKYL